MTSTAAALAALAEKLKDDLAHADRHLASLQALPSLAANGYEGFAAAYLLQQIYGAIEAMVERGVRTFDGVSPSGDDWHIRLLERAAKEVPGVRVAILPTSDAVDELRRFRHRVRKRYDDELDASLLGEVISSTIEGWADIRTSLVTFVRFVDDCATQAGEHLEK
jgi:hypothetical protein